MNKISHQLKKTSVFLLIFIVLLCVVAAQKIVSMKGQETITKEQDIFGSTQVDSITKISIKADDKEQILKKDGDVWVVESANNFSADKELMDEIFSTLKQSKVTIEASKDKKKASSFGVEEKSGVVVNLFKGDAKIIGFIIGKLAPDYMSTYVAVEGKDPIYAVSGNLESAFHQEDFRNKKIVNAEDSNAVTGVTLAYPKETITLAKKDSAWEVSGVKDVDQSKVTSFMSILVGLQAEEIPDNQSQEKHFDAKIVSVKIQASNAEEEILVGEKKDGQYYVSNSKKIIYLVSESTIDDILKKQQDFEKKE